MKTQEEIKKDVVDQLYWDYRVDASKVKVKIDGSTVNLEGSVANYNAKNNAELDAWSIEGVSIVHNNLEVEYPPTLELPTDEEIKTNVESTLILNNDIDSSTVDVSVTGGIVTLKGSVDAYWKKVKAENLISDLTGVISILNKLTIVPTKSFVDQDIAEDIISSISRNINVDVENVNVKVENGVVTLSGTVSDWSAYTATMEAARYTAGVVDINDNLIIETL
ncbi:MAG: BON domain-containing protein [Candidatus Lokiarchaeota archaeon]|nr:BON domain-containing protein [Candidatus Lokiarchaeota archaeon]